MCFSTRACWRCTCRRRPPVTSEPFDELMAFTNACPAQSLALGNFSLLTGSGAHINANAAVTFVGNVGAGSDVQLMSGSITGNVYSPAISLGSTTVSGTQSGYTAVATTAYANANALFQSLYYQTCTGAITSGTQTFTTSGVYCFTGAYNLATSWTFSAASPGDVYILQFFGAFSSIGGTMVLNTALPCNIFIVINGNVVTSGTTNVKRDVAHRRHFQTRWRVDSDWGCVCVWRLHAGHQYHCQQRRH